MKKVRKHWANKGWGAILGTQMTVDGVVQWRKLLCPLSSDDSACGEWCSFFDVETSGGVVGLPSREVVTCQGRPIGELVAEDVGTDAALPVLTAEQERAAIAAWLRLPTIGQAVFNSIDLLKLAMCIERGEHWINGGKEDVIRDPQSEVCCACGGRTGRAGRTEDSLYMADSGPFCEACFEVQTEELAMVNDTLRKRVAEVESEVEMLKAQQHDAFVAYQQLAEKLAVAMRQNMDLEDEVDRLNAG